MGYYKQLKTMLTKFKDMENVYPRKDLRRLRRYRYPRRGHKSKRRKKTKNAGIKQSGMRPQR